MELKFKLIEPFSREEKEVTFYYEYGELKSSIGSLSSSAGNVIGNLADMDEWKHSWHNDFSKIRDESTMEKAMSIIDEKIKKRKEEIAELEKGKELISSLIFEQIF